MHPIFLIGTIFYLQHQLTLAMTNPTSSSAATSSSASSAGGAYPQILPSESPIVALDGDSTLISVTGRMNYITAGTKQVEIHRHKDGTDSGMQGSTWKSADVPIANGRLLNKNLLFPESLNDDSTKKTAASMYSNEIDQLRFQCPTKLPQRIVIFTPTWLSIGRFGNARIE